jgi:hypothetical protein
MNFRNPFFVYGVLGKDRELIYAPEKDVALGSEINREGQMKAEQRDLRSWRNWHR